MQKPESVIDGIAFTALRGWSMRPLATVMRNDATTACRWQRVPTCRHTSRGWRSAKH